MAHEFTPIQVGLVQVYSNLVELVLGNAREHLLTSCGWPRSGVDLAEIQTFGWFARRLAYTIACK